MKNINQQKIPEEMLLLLKEGTFAYLCTTDKKSWMPHIATIFYVFDPNTQGIYFITSPTSKKYRNLVDYPKISLTIDKRNVQNPFNNEGILVRGTARSIFQFWSPELKVTLKAKNHHNSLGLFTEEYHKTSEMIFHILKLFQEKYPQFLSTPGRDVEIVAGSLERVLVEVSMKSISYWRNPKFKKFKMRP